MVVDEGSLSESAVASLKHDHHIGHGVVDAVKRTSLRVALYHSCKDFR